MKVDMDYHFATVLMMDENHSLKSFRSWPMNWTSFDRQLELKSEAVRVLLRKAIERQAHDIKFNLHFINNGLENYLEKSRF